VVHLAYFQSPKTSGTSGRWTKSVERVNAQAKANADAFAAKAKAFAAAREKTARLAAQANAQAKANADAFAAKAKAARLEVQTKAKAKRDAQTKAKAKAKAEAERIAQAAKTADGEAVYRAKMRRELAQEKSTTQDALNAYRLLEAEHQQATNELAQVDQRIIQAALSQKKLQNGESPLKEFSKLQRRTLNTIGLGNVSNKQSFGLAAITIALGITAILGRVD